ncbi:AraC-like DNA-binding protein [Flavobacterium arsenatis]|uniref:AraC-like DNA-binding protein n=1 Tax=Flavobacterium arsenatis TaxID=1484332 RepID=A0ABU1TU85_9FLAO|nr:AraC family transcriptional regulator [Flavobacterium arsenatis]MDR6969448.1 AraC-like DNA-binding protein [Flavobacterium arsenatis]
MKSSNNLLLIKNMVCPRCILSVENIFQTLEIPTQRIDLGEVVLKKELNPSELKNLETELKKVGFELIETRINKIVEDIKKRIFKFLDASDKKVNLSTFITSKIHYDYSYLSDLFSSIEGKSIEQFFIIQRIEKVKELLVYDQLSLTEIAYKTGFSSVHHLSAQFKKVTGLSPSLFKKIGNEKRKSIDSL